jgi:hypothetical protein
MEDLNEKKRRRGCGENKRQGAETLARGSERGAWGAAGAGSPSRGRRGSGRETGLSSERAAKNGATPPARGDGYECRGEKGRSEWKRRNIMKPSTRARGGSQEAGRVADAVAGRGGRVEGAVGVGVGLVHELPAARGGVGGGAGGPGVRVWTGGWTGGWTGAGSRCLVARSGRRLHGAGPQGSPPPRPSTRTPKPPQRTGNSRCRSTRGRRSCAACRRRRR